MLKSRSLFPSVSRRWSALVGLLGLSLVTLGGAQPAHAQVTYSGGQSTEATYASGDTISPLAVDSNGNQFYVVNNGTSNTLYELSPGSSPTVLNSSFPDMPSALTVNSSGSTLYFIFSNGGTTCGGSTHYKHVGMVSTAANSTPSTLPDCFSIGTTSNLSYTNPMDVAVDSSGNLYVGDQGAGSVDKIPAPVTSSSTPTTELTLVQQPWEIAYYGGYIYYGALNSSSTTTLYRAAASQFSSSNPPPTASSSALGTLQSIQLGMAAGPNGEIYINGYAQIQEYNNGSLSTFDTLATGTNLNGVGTDSSGTVYYSGSDSSGAPFVARTGASAVNFGSVNIGSSNTLSVPFTIGASASTTVTSIKVLTAGATGLDFTNASGSTCTATTYATSTSCVVNVKFAPRFSGLRRGAVVFMDGSTVLSTTYLYGTGSGPEVAFNSPITPGTLGGGFTEPYGMAVDGAGNVYVADYSNKNVTETPAGCTSSSCVTTLGGSFTNPVGVAVDGAGNIYVADFANSQVTEIPAGCTAADFTASSCSVTTLGGGFTSPFGVAVDGAGNVYVADFGNGKVKEMPPGCTSSSCVTTLGGGFQGPVGVAVDGAGNVYVADYTASKVTEMPAGCTSSSCVTTLGGGFNVPIGVAVDGAGNVYVANYGNNTVTEAPAGCLSSSCVTPFGGTFSFPVGAAVDGAGNLYIANSGNGTVNEIARATPPSLSFASTNVGATSSDSPQTVTVQNIGSGTLTFPIPTTAGAYNPSVSTNFSYDNTSTCQQNGASAPTAFTLASAASCTVAIDFTPTTGGSISGNAVLTDDSLNAASPNYTTQSISLSGTGVNPVTQLAFSTPPPSTLTAGGNSGTVSVAEENSSGTTVTGASDTITLMVTGPNGYSQTYTQTASSGVASFNLSSATLQTVGTYTYTATSGSYTKATVTQTVSAASASKIAVVSGSPQSAVIGASFTNPLVVKVTDSYGNAVSGATVVFTAPTSGASATLSTPAKTGTNGETSVTATANGLAGPYTVTASTSGATGTASFSLTNTKHATTLTVTPSATSLVYGQPVTVAAAISPSTVQGTAPTGSMTFYDGATALTPNSTVASAAASYTVNVPTVGSHTYAATYLGDNNFLASSQTSAASAVVVGKASSKLAGPATTTVVYGQSGSIAISVTGQYSGSGIATPSGSIGYSIGGTAVSGTSPITSGAATIPVPNTLAVGKYTVTVTYGGDANYNAATSIPLALTISKGTATVTLSNLSQTYTGSPLPVTVTTNPTGLSVSLTYNGSNTVPTDAGSYSVVATVTDPNYTGSATGTLVIKQATPVIQWPAPASITYGTALSSTQLDATASYNGSPVAGTFVYTPAAGTVLSPGTHTLSVTFTPTNTKDFTTATASVSLTVAKATPIIQWPAPASITYGTPLSSTQLDATASYNGTPVAGTFAYTPGAGTVLSAGVQTLSVVFTPSDTTTYTTATATVSLTVGKAATAVALTSSTSNANLNASITFTATVTSQTTGTPTGSVQFLDGSTVLGTSPLNNNGVATYMTSSLTAGLHQITAVYQGDVNFSGSTSAALAQIVTAPDFSLMSSVKNLTLKAGQTGDVTISMVSMGGFKGTVQFSCSGLPTNSHCALIPTTLTADGSNSTQTATLNIYTYGPNTGTVAMVRHPGKPNGIMLAGLFWLPGLLLGGFLFWKRRKLTARYGSVLLLVLVATTMAGMVGCGVSRAMTATGTSSVKVTATSGTTTHTVTVDVTITK